MRKVICTSIVLLLILGGLTASFATEATSGSAAASTDTAVTAEAAVEPASDMTFTGPAIKLSLEDAYKKMLADSFGAKIAELNKQSAEGVAKGLGESVQYMKRSEQKAETAIDFLNSDPSNTTNVAIALEIEWSYDKSNKKMLEANKKYATEQGPKNYQAEINSLKRDTLENYYKLKELENQVAIAKDNVALKEKLLANTQLKYKLGTVSKNDVLKAETAVYEAKDGLLAAESGLKSMKMGFNIFMGYDLMQDVTLTDSIKEVPLSAKSLDASIKDALSNRNEISESVYNLEMSKLGLDSVIAYPRSSSKYIKANMAVLSAETGARNVPLQVESDVRTKYMNMYTKYSAVQTGKKSVDNAKETVRLAQLQYDAGMATLSDVEGAQLAYYNEQLSYSKALLEYNLAVQDYELASTVGTQTSVIK